MFLSLEMEIGLMRLGRVGGRNRWVEDRAVEDRYWLRLKMGLVMKRCLIILCPRWYRRLLFWRV